MRHLILLAALVSGVAQARDVHVPFDAYLDLESGRWATESDCLMGLTDCRVMDLKVRHSDKHEPRTFLEFPRNVQQARTSAAPANVAETVMTDLAQYVYASSYGFLPETLVVQKGSRTFAIQLVSEDADGVTLRYELVAQTRAPLVD